MAFLMLLSVALAAEQRAEQSAEQSAEMSMRSEQALSVEPLVLQGRQAERSVVIQGPSQGSLALSLVLQASERVDPEQSWLTVSMDGVPVRTTSLAAVYQDGAAGTLNLNLPAIDKGFHTLSLKSSLWTDQDPCLERDAGSAWLRVDPSSRVSWVHMDAQGGLTSLVEDWQFGDVPVSLVLPAVPTESGVAALLSTQRLLLGWGLETTLEPGGATIHLMQASALAEDDPQWAAGLATLRSSADAQVVLDREGDTLRVLTLSPELWSQALSALTPELLARCTDLPCVLGPLPPETLLASQTQATPSSLAGLGMKRGVVFEGDGAHTLRLPFSRPASARVTEAPVVDLRVKLPQGIDLRASSTASLWLGDRPIETWKLHSGEQRLVARLPEFAWKDASWELRLELQLDPETPDCHAIDSKHNWIQIDPESAVLLTLEEPHFAGLSGFERATREEPATLRFNPELTWPQWQLAGALLAATPIKAAPIPWTQDCIGPCIQPQVASVRDPLAAWVANSPAWKDPAGTEDLPLSATLGYPAFHASDCTDGNCQTLSLYIPRNAKAPENAPPLSALVGRQAVYDGQNWVSLDEDAEPALTLARLDQASGTDAVKTVSSSQAKLTRIDLSLLGILLLVATLGGLWLYRSTKQQDNIGPVDIEIEEA
jgi:hypothetical protein